MSFGYISGEETKTKFKVNSELLEEFEVKVGMNQ